MDAQSTGSAARPVTTVLATVFGLLFSVTAPTEARQTIAAPPMPRAGQMASPAVNELPIIGPVAPAEVVVLSLSDLGFPDGADRVTASGAVSEALIREGTLRFWTPGDTGADQEARFVIGKGGAVGTRHLLIRSQRPIKPVAHVEARGNGALAAAPPKLIVSGLGPNNRITGQALTFKLAGMPTLDLKDDSDALVLGGGNASIGLKKYWAFNAADASFTVSAAALRRALAGIPDGSVSLSLNIVSKDGEFAAVYDLLAIKPGAKLSGKVTTPQGIALTSLAGKRILLAGLQARQRLVAVIDSEGAFVFDSLVPDTYRLTLNDLEHPNVVSASMEIAAGTREASATLIYGLGDALTGRGR